MFYTEAELDDIVIATMFAKLVIDMFILHIHVRISDLVIEFYLKYVYNDVICVSIYVV